MIPLYLDTYLFPAGIRVLHNGADPMGKKSTHEGWLDKAIAFYLPKRKKALPEEDGRASPLEDATDEGDIPELGIVAGITTEPIFAVLDANDTETFVRGWKYAVSWAAEYMREGNFRDLVVYLEDIYEDLLALEIPEPVGRNNPGAAFALISMTLPETPLEEITEVEPIHVLTLWTAESCRDWETGIDELEGFHYAGIGQVAQEPRAMRQKISETDSPQTRAKKEEINKLVREGLEATRSASLAFNAAEKARDSLRKEAAEKQKDVGVPGSPIQE